MDNSPTSTINFDRANPAPAREEQPLPDKPDTKKRLFTAAIALTVAVVVCFMAVIVIEIGYRVGGAPSLPGGPDNGISYIGESVSADDIHKGDLILVKEGYEYVFPSAEDANLVSVTENQNNAYFVNNLKTDPTLNADVIKKFNAMMLELKQETGFSGVSVHEGYRTYKKQDGYYNSPSITDEVPAGFSEHHLGTAIDLKAVDPESKLTYALAEKENVYGWLMANCYKFGFIDRYPDDKIKITGIEHDRDTNPPSTHIRYVGYAHAYYMYENDLCLEEYLELLRTNYSYEGEHLTFTADDGNAYEVYYCKAEGKQIELPVPEDYDYSISGDNMNGFIVTVCFGEANG